MSVSLRFWKAPVVVWSSIRRRPARAFALSLVFVSVLAGVGVFIWNDQVRRVQADLNQFRPVSARLRAERLLKIWPYQASLQLLAARAARLTGDYDACDQYLIRSKSLSGSATEAYQLEYTLLRAQTGELDRVAEGLFTMVEAGHPESEQILETMANGYMNRLQYMPAEACLNLWILRFPESSRAYYRRGWVLERLGHYKPAVEDYRKAVQIDPQLLPARLRLVEILIEEKMPLEAAPYLDELIRQAPDRPDVKVRVGMSRFLQGQNEEARRWLEEAERELPTDPTVALYLARLDLQDGLGESAERRCRQTIERDRSEVEVRFVLISALRLQGKHDEADKAAIEHKWYLDRNQRITDLLKDRADSATAGPAVWNEIATLMIEIGQDKRSLYWLEKCLKKDPENQPALRMLADYYDRSGDSAKAKVIRANLKPS